MIVHLVITLIFTLALPLAAVAGSYDGSKTLRCVPTDAVSCAGAGECERMTARELGLPQYVKLDFKKKTILGTLENGEERKTPIEHMKKGEYSTTIQGGEYERAWSFVIQHDTGKLSGAIVGYEGGIILLGACDVD
jgi:hypothetical protein